MTAVEPKALLNLLLSLEAREQKRGNPRLRLWSSIDTDAFYMWERLEPDVSQTQDFRSRSACAGYTPCPLMAFLRVIAGTAWLVSVSAFVSPLCKPRLIPSPGIAQCSKDLFLGDFEK